MNFRFRRPRLILFALLVVAIAVGLFFYSSRSNEPVYQGYPLTRWVHSYEAVNGGGSREARSERALAAIKSIGTNALPWMLSAIDREPSPLRAHFRIHSGKLPSWLLNWSFVHRLQVDDAEAASTAMRTFEILGPDAAPAIPLLEQLARSTNKPNSATRAVIALGYIGRDAVPTIANLLKEPRLLENWAMLYSLKHMGTNAAAAVPVLIDHLTDTNPAIVVNSTTLLANLALNAEQSVPALTRALTNQDSIVRRRAAEGLEEFGAAARSALPALTNTLRDVDPDVRKSATSAIQAITLETAKGTHWHFPSAK
ncbi:hypothetical protein GC207_15380 [bacterium]|nr:hypothetical protein [bacterium]